MCRSHILIMFMLLFLFGSKHASCEIFKFCFYFERFINHPKILKNIPSGNAYYSCCTNHLVKLIHWYIHTRSTVNNCILQHFYFAFILKVFTFCYIKYINALTFAFHVNNACVGRKCTSPLKKHAWASLNPSFIEPTD